MLKYVIWGAGHRGEIIYKILGEESVSCFIDSSPAKQELGGEKRVYSYEEYKKTERKEIIIVSPALSADITEILDSDGISYFFLDECPTEFMGYGILTAKSYLQNLPSCISDHCALYGITLYTVWLYEKLKAQGKKDVVFIRQKDSDDALLERLAEELEEFRIIDIGQAEGEKRQLYVCLYDDFLNDRTIPNTYVDLFDLSRNFIPYKNPRIEEFRDVHRGERCFIVATGPSLRIDDLETLRRNNEFCISMNTIFYCFEKTTWRPDIYCVLDGAIIDKWKNKIENLDVSVFFVGDSSIKEFQENLEGKLYVYHSMSGKYYMRNPKITTDFSEKVFNSGSVTFISIQLAIYLGFTDIYLLGTDFSYNIGKKNNHFMSGKSQNNEYNFSRSIINESLYYAQNSYRCLKLEAEQLGHKIYNATRGGALEVFERVDFDSLF